MLHTREKYVLELNFELLLFLLLHLSNINKEEDVHFLVKKFNRSQHAVDELAPVFEFLLAIDLSGHWCGDAALGLILLLLLSIEVKADGLYLFFEWNFLKFIFCRSQLHIFIVGYLNLLEISCKWDLFKHVGLIVSDSIALCWEMDRYLVLKGGRFITALTENVRISTIAELIITARLNVDINIIDALLNI